MTIASPPQTDLDLLRDHLAGSPHAFTELVHRHIDMVYASALRQVRDPHLADDVTQAVFLLLWQKAGTMGKGTILPAWLHRAARYCAANALRLRTIRQRHEQRAAQMSPRNVDRDNQTAAEDAELSSVLDKAVARLSSTDRTAVIMRYFEGKSADDVAVALRVTPDAARKRIERAVAKLHKILSRLGVKTAAPALATFLASRAIVQSPPHVVASVTQTIAAASAGSGAAAASSAGVIAKGALVAMTAKTQATVAAAIILLLLAGGLVAYLAMRPEQTPAMTANPAATAKPAPARPGVTAARVTVSPEAPLPPIAANTIRVQAYIDGRSRLCLRGKTAQWLNLEYFAPGAFNKLDRPTLVNGQKWHPVWFESPLDPTKGVSDQYEGIDPPLPLAAVNASVQPLKARGPVSIVQHPDAANQYTLIVEFDDSGPAGAADYIVDITYAPADAPTATAAEATTPPAARQ